VLPDEPLPPAADRCDKSDFTSHLNVTDTEHIYRQNDIDNITRMMYESPFSGTTQVSRYQKSKTNLDFTEARDSEWQWHQLGHMQVCTSLQIDNHASTPPLRFLQAGCSSCRPTNSVKALKANINKVA